MKTGIKTAFIVNGRGRSRLRFYKNFDRARTSLQGEFDVVTTSFSSHAENLAKEMAQSGYSHIIAVGGDGTLHEVVNGIIRSGQTNVAVGLLPNGTANDYARTLGASFNMKHLLGAINEGHTTPVNLGSIRFADGQRKVFMNIAEVGLGVDVVKRVNGSGRWLGSDLTFATAILRSFMSYKNKPIQVKTSDWSWEGKVNSFIIANGRYFGSGLCIAPNASPENSQFSIVIIGDVSIRDYLKYLPMLKKGELLTHPEVMYKEAQELEISSNEELGIEADGEYLGNGPATISLEPRSIRFITAMRKP